MNASNSHVTINGQRIPWAFVQKLRISVFHGDWDSTMDAFWKAKGAKGIIAYITAGLKPDEKNRRYILYPSAERNAGKMEMIRRWWETDVYKPKGTGDMLSVKQIFRQLAG